MRAPAPTDPSSSPRRWVLALTLLAGALPGCDLSGAEAAEKAAAQREADGKAVGSACRHAGRAIEDCYALNTKAQRSAVFAGWREMDEYMRENKLEAVAPSLPPPGAKAEKGDKSERGEKSAGKPERNDRRAAADAPRSEAGAQKVDLPPKPRIAKPDQS